VRLLVRSEPEAFRLTVGMVFAVGLAVLIGYLFGPVTGIVLLVALTFVALLRDFAAIRSDRSALGDAARSGHGRADREDRPHVLVIANETVAGDALLREIERRGRPRPVLDVVAPVLQSRSHFVTTDIDRETEAARRRLQQTLEWAADHQLEATGVVGDPIAPFAAVEDELRLHDFDEVVLATHPDEQANWLETRMLERVRKELDVPVKQLVIHGRS
jgi:hypothetical protein